MTDKLAWLVLCTKKKADLVDLIFLHFSWNVHLSFSYNNSYSFSYSRSEAWTSSPPNTLTKCLCTKKKAAPVGPVSDLKKARSWFSLPFLCVWYSMHWKYDVVRKCFYIVHMSMCELNMAYTKNIFCFRKAVKKNYLKYSNISNTSSLVKDCFFLRKTQYTLPFSYRQKVSWTILVNKSTRSGDVFISNGWMDKDT